MDDEGVTYGLTLAVLARTPFVEITSEEFETAKRAKALVTDALGSEESLNLVLGNYLEYETKLLAGALQLLVYSEETWSDFTGRIHAVNRRVANLLSAGRAYLDQAAHYVGRFFGKQSSELRTFRAWMAAEYDTSFGYRAMEALRNFTQHRGIAVHRLSHQMWRKGTRGVRRNALVPSIHPRRFVEEGGFKASVLRELVDRGDVIDLRPLIKEYVAGIARVHDQLRNLMAAHVDQAEQKILALIDRYKNEGQADVLGLSAVKRDAEGRWSDKVALFDDPIERRRSLVRRMRRARHLANLYTTNEPKE